MLLKSELVRRPKDLMQDGWGNEFDFDYDNDASEIRFSSAKYDAYCEKKNINPEYPWDDDDTSL